MAKFERPKSLTLLVADHLRQAIVDGLLDPGEALSEVTIARQLDVSRTPVREAFAHLELEGLVRSEPQRGTFVFSMNRAELIAICDVRVVLESGALRIAAQANRERLARSLSGIVVRMTKARDSGNARAYLTLDTAFHQTMVDCTGNKYLNQAYQTIAPRMTALRNRLGDHADHMEKSFAEHRRIAELIADGQIDPAVDLLTAHIGHKEGSYWSL